MDGTRRQRWDGIWEIVLSGDRGAGLPGVLERLGRDRRAWLVLDPMAHLRTVAWPRRETGVAVFVPRWPEEMVAAAVVAARHGVEGVVLLDVDGVVGLWGAHGPELVLWPELARLALPRRVTVVSVRWTRLGASAASTAASTAVSTPCG